MLTKFTLFLLSIQIIFTNNVSELIQPKCKNKKAEYSILVDIKEYLNNEDNIDGREFYSNIEDLKSKNAKIGTLSFFQLNDFPNAEKYNTLEDLVESLRKHKVDAIFTDDSYANITQIYSTDLSQIPGEVNNISCVFICKKNYTIYQKIIEFQNMNIRSGRFHSTHYKWMGINEEGYYIDKNLRRNLGTVTALVFEYPPFAFLDEKGELVGSLVSFIYGFCAVNGYQLDIRMTASIDELNQAIQNNSFDIVNTFLPDNGTSEYPVITIGVLPLNPIIRYSSYPESTIWSIYESPKDLDGEVLGCLKNYSFEYLYDENFPNSDVKMYDNNYDLLYFLLREDIEGYLTDETIAKNNVKKFPERITYFDMNVTNDLGFAFKKNDTILINEFNQFLEKQDVEKLYEKWNVKDTSEIKAEKYNIGENAETIKVGLLTDSYPFCFNENDEIKGIEVDLIYQFAKSKNYNVDIVEFFSAEERFKIVEKDSDFNITGGHFTITEERSQIVSFSNPIYKIGTSLVVRTDSKIDAIKLTILDKEFNEIPDNKAKLLSKVGNKTVTSLCAFPDFYKNSLILNCSINDFNGTDPFTQGIESTTSEDKLKIVYSYLEIDNILKGNEKLKLPIIQESDKSEHICSEENKLQESKISPIIAASAGVALLSLIFTILRFCL